MRFLLYSSLIVTVALLATNPVLADSNASGGGIENTETVSLGAGPFDHADAVGSVDNTILTGITFTGGFNATHVRFTGTLTSVIPATWGSEANIQIREGLFSTFDWENPGPGAAYTTFDYDFADELDGDFAGGVDPGVGQWTLEFFDTFDDTDTGDGDPATDPAVDSQSTNVEMIFEERSEVSDSNGVFSLGSLNVGDTNTSEGEFAIASLYDLYSITLNEAGLFSFFTDEDPNGFVGANVDTEIAIFDSNGFLLAENDDDPDGGLYSAITDLELEAGDYTLAVAPFLGGDSFADGFVVTPGTATGDYIISASLTQVPEPGTLAFLGFGCIGIMAYRRRRQISE